MKYNNSSPGLTRGPEDRSTKPQDPGLCIINAGGLEVRGTQSRDVGSSLAMDYKMKTQMNQTTTTMKNGLSPRLTRGLRVEKRNRGRFPSPDLKSLLTLSFFPGSSGSRVNCSRRWILAVVIIVFGSLSNMLIAQRVLTLEESIQIAQQSSPDIRKSKLNLVSNQKSLAAQRASLKSQFSLDVTPFIYSQNRSFNESFSDWSTSQNYFSFGTFRVSQPILATDGVLELTNTFSYRDSNTEFDELPVNSGIITYSNDLGINFTQPIFTYNTRKLELKELELNLEDAMINNSLQLLTLEQQVTQSFYNFYQLQNDLTIARDELENQEVSYEITQNKVEADLLAKEELYQAELNLATSKSTLENNEVSLANAADDFKLLLGLPLEEDISVDVDVDFITSQVDLNQAIQYGLESRMELRQREITIERSQFDLTRTRALNEFKGSVDLSMGIIGVDPVAAQVYDMPQTTPRVGISFSIPIWDWGEKKARLAASNATLQINEIDLEQEKNNIIIDIRKTYRSLQNLENQIEIAEQNVKNAELTYEINLERYRNGDLTSIDLNQFQSQLSDKKSELAAALINYKIELLNLKILSLYDFEKQQPVIAQPELDTY
ncbi:MAG: TolC family protein [Bacteroidota bacterium]